MNSTDQQFKLLVAFFEAQCAPHKGLLRFDGVHLVLNENGCFHCAFSADRDLLSEDDADSAVFDMMALAKDEFQSWNRQFQSTVAPFTATKSPATSDAIARAETSLHAWMNQHSPTCKRHNDPDRALFLNEINHVLGWSSAEDHLCAHFCVEGATTSVRDEICCARAIAALTRTHPDLDGILWRCSSWT